MVAPRGIRGGFPRASVAACPRIARCRGGKTARRHGEKVQSVQSRLQTAQSQLERQKAESTSAKMQAGMSILTGVLGTLFGGKRRAASMSTITRGKSVLTSATGAFKQGQDVTAAEQKSR